MKSRSFLALIVLIGFVAWAQNPSATQSPSGGAQTQSTKPAKPQAHHREQMQAMCKEPMETMKTDAQNMRSAIEKMKANVAQIANADEKARWQANLDLWNTVLEHHEQMLKHMQHAQATGMGCGMMMDDMADMHRPMKMKTPMSAETQP
jgi:hypothetical protein